MKSEDPFWKAIDEQVPEAGPEFWHDLNLRLKNIDNNDEAMELNSSSARPMNMETNITFKDKLADLTDRATGKGALAFGAILGLIAIIIFSFLLLRNVDQESQIDVANENKEKNVVVDIDKEDLTTDETKISLELPEEIPTTRVLTTGTNETVENQVKPEITMTETTKPLLQETVIGLEPGRYCYLFNFDETQSELSINVTADNQGDIFEDVLFEGDSYSRFQGSGVFVNDELEGEAIVRLLLDGTRTFADGNERNESYGMILEGDKTLRLNLQVYTPISCDEFDLAR